MLVHPHVFSRLEEYRIDCGTVGNAGNYSRNVPERKHPRRSYSGNGDIPDHFAHEATNAARVPSGFVSP